MPALVTFIDNCERFGVQMVWPHPRAGAIWDVFEVESDTFDPESPTMTITRGREDRHKYGGSELVPGDMLLHIQSGVVARVIERIDHATARIEGWCQPDGVDDEHTKKSVQYWNENQAKGGWVVWGQCFAHGEQLPFTEGEEVKVGACLPEDLQRRAMEARFDTFKHPERRGLKERVPPLNERLTKKRRKEMSRDLLKWANMDWKQYPGEQPFIPKDLSAITDEEMDKRTFFRKTLKKGEIRQWWYSMQPCAEELEKHLKKNG